MSLFFFFQTLIQIKSWNVSLGLISYDIVGVISIRIKCVRIVALPLIYTLQIFTLLCRHVRLALNSSQTTLFCLSQVSF